MKVLIAGGGTAGHINPGIAIANHIKQKHPDAQILFVGTSRGLESKLVPRAGFEIRLITVRGFQRKLSLQTLKAVKELFQGMRQAGKIIKDFRPDVVIGTGGYVCGPVGFIAARRKIPLLIHEQNAFPGVTNRILSRFADAVAMSFNESKQFFKHAKKLVLTGNPIRSELLSIDKGTARKNLQMDTDKSLVVVMGGSLGAGKINETMIQLLKTQYKNEDCRMIFATGNNAYESVISQLKDVQLPNVEIVPYIFDSTNVYAAADLIICRAGAITVSELAVMGIPSIMIPSPNVTANHQEYNARAMEKQGGSVLILEKVLNAPLLYNQMTDLLKDRELLSKMGRSAKRAGIANSAEKIYSVLMEIIRK